MLTERQQQAQALASELHKLGVAVTNPMPLAAGAKLRFNLPNDLREQVLERISQWGWSPTFVQSGLQFCIRSYSAKPYSMYELDLPPDRQTITQDRSIFGEVSVEDKTTREARKRESEAFLRHAGLLK